MMTKRTATVEYFGADDKYRVSKFENGQRVHVSEHDESNLAEQAKVEWLSGGGPELIVE
jgi:hypothetical protein